MLVRFIYNSLGINRLTRFCILCFKIATQDAKSWFCECHQSGKNFSEEKSSWTFWQIYQDKWVVEVDYRRITLLKTFGEGGEWWGILLFFLLKKILDETAFIDFSLWKLLYTIKPLNGVWDLWNGITPMPPRWEQPCTLPKNLFGFPDLVSKFCKFPISPVEYV